MMVPLPHKMRPVVCHHPVPTIEIHRMSGSRFGWTMRLSHTIRMMPVFYVCMARLLVRVVFMRTSMRMRPTRLVCFGNVKLRCQ